MRVSSSTHTRYARLDLAPGGNLAFSSSYDPVMIETFKRQIPSTHRRWDAEQKCWIVAPQYADVCVQLAKAYLGVDVHVPPLKSPPAKTETRVIRLDYVGAMKERGDGERSAYGYVAGTWSIIFPESVLRTYFEAEPPKPGEQPTLYSVLAVKPSATPDELKTAYRRLVRQWHPDVCHEPDAAEQFKAIQHAYEILSDPAKRKKYDAGRALEQNAREAIRQTRSHPYDGLTYTPDGELTYRPPLRCGILLVEGKESLRGFVVETILGWEDVTDAQGRVMVSTWHAGDDKPTIIWR